jgi:hypothetical protein
MVSSQKLAVLSFHNLERNTDCLVTVVKVHIHNLLVVVDDRENTRVKNPSVRLLPVVLPFSSQSQEAVSLPHTYTGRTGSPTAREEDGMVLNAGAMASLSRKVRSPMWKRTCAW